MRPTRSLVFLGALLAALARPCGSAALVIPAPQAPIDRPGPGTMITTFVPPLPPGVDECERLLVPGSGPAIRVSPEASVGPREIRWRMPVIAARSARLVASHRESHTESTFRPRSNLPAFRPLRN